MLTDIEKNAEQFMGTAGFKLEQFRRRVQLAYEYIESWKMEKNPCYKPTWSGFFAVLRQIGLDPLATSIDGILKEISPPHEPLDECKDPENGMAIQYTSTCMHV